MIVVQDNPGALPLALYLKDLHYLESPVVHRVTAIDVVAVAPHRGLGGFCWWGSECNLVPSRLDRNYDIPGFHVVRRLRVEDFRMLGAQGDQADHGRAREAPGRIGERASELRPLGSRPAPGRATGRAALAIRQERDVHDTLRRVLREPPARRSAFTRHPTGSAVAALTILAAALRLYRIGHQGLWFDEAYTVMLVKLPFAKLLSTVPKTESTPYLYYLLAWVWTHIFGRGAADLRALSALVGTAVVPIGYLAAAKLTANRRAALIVAALATFNPLLIWYSQEARAYELLVLMSACTLLAFA